MKIILIFLISLMLTLISLYSLAQNSSSEIRFDHLSNTEGLSQNTVRALLQDNKGFIWIGMEDGLNRFDSDKFKSYGFDSQNKSSNAFNFINVLFEDHKKSIWVGTRSDGLYKYNWETEIFKSFLFDKDSANFLLTNSVTAITEDNKGYLWIGTERGLTKIDPNDGTYKRYLHDPDNNTSISSNDILSLKIQGNILWIGTRLGGLNKLNLDTEIFAHYSPNSKNPLQPSSKTINSISLDNSSKIWLGTTSGVEILDTENGQVQSLDEFTDISVNKILFDSQKKIWLGSEEGLFLFDSLKNGWTHFANDPGNFNSFRGSRINDIIEDHSGGIWIGTRFAGINKYDPVKHKFSTLRNDPSSTNSIPSNIIRCFWEDHKNRLWIGTTAGLTHFDRQKNLYKTVTRIPGDENSLTHNDIRSIISDSKDNLWLGTRDGLSYYDPDKQTFKNFKYDPDNPNSLGGNHIRILLKDSENLWIGTHNNGLSKLNISTSIFTRYFGDTPDRSVLDAKRITALFSDNQSALWIGTSGNGIFKMVLDENGTEQFIQYTVNESSGSLPTNIIKSFFEDEDGNFWVSTANGFCKMNRENGTFKTYLPKDGLGNKMVYGIVQDDSGDLWMSTNNGLSRFNNRSEKFTNYFEHDGLQANEFNTNAFFKTEDGLLFFGGINGMNLFDPGVIADDHFVPKVIITDFQLFYESQNPETGGFLNSHVSALEEIELKHDQNVFSFEFILLDYTNPRKNQYKYMMEGFDDDWNVENNRNYATYTNLSAGEYAFKVIGSNSAGTWNEEPVVINVIIQPPWWKTWWFIISSGFVIASLLFGFIWMRQQELKRQTSKKEKLEGFQYALKQIIKINEDLDKVESLKLIYREVVRLISVALNVERVSIWTFIENGKSIVSESLYQKSKDKFEEGLLLKPENFPSYFAELSKEIIIVANNATTHQATYEFTETYLNPLNIKSMLDVPIKIQGKTKAIICCEQIETFRSWDKYEQEFIISVASTLALSMESFERIKAISVLNEYKTNLEQRVIERTNDLNEALVKEKELGELKSRFVSMASHEFRTPLSSINFAVGFLGKYGDRIDPEQFQEKVNKIEKQVSHMTYILDDVLLIGKSEAKMINCNPIKINMHAYLDEIIEEVKISSNNSHKVKLTWKGDRDYIFMDEKLGINIFTNLLNNGIKFSPKAKKIEVFVDTTADETIVIVKDFGIGIDPAEINKVFEPFHRAENVGAISGSGLGLSIAKKAIDLHEGTIEVKSEIGKGTEFVVTIPCLC